MDSSPFAYAEELVDEGYLFATYYLEATSDFDTMAEVAAFARGQSTGTWTPVRGLTDDMLRAHTARVVGVYEVPPVEMVPDLSPGSRRFIIRIAFPEINIGQQFPLLLTTLLGSEVSTSLRLKLVDLQLPRTFVEGFQGPRFGIGGLRALLDIPQRPILMSITKPSTGFGSEVGSSFFEQAARGGADIVKDDELLGDLPFNRIKDRVKLHRELSHRVFEETGHRTAYCVNVTDRPDRILEHVKRVQGLGAGLVMINGIAVGLGTIRTVTEDPSVSIPVLMHHAGAGAWTESPRAGVSSEVLLGKLARLAGADAVMHSSIYSSQPLMRDRYMTTARFLRMPLYDLQPSLPVVGGGVHPQTAVRIIQDLGPDTMLAVGGAVHGHPGGAAAGARAMRQAISAAVDGADLPTRAAEQPELKEALALWGDAGDSGDEGPDGAGGRYAR